MKFDCPVFDDCKEGLEKAKENMLKVEELEKNGEMFIYNDFNKNLKTSWSSKGEPETTDRQLLGRNDKINRENSDWFD